MDGVSVMVGVRVMVGVKVWVGAGVPVGMEVGVSDGARVCVLVSVGCVVGVKGEDEKAGPLHPVRKISTRINKRVITFNPRLALDRDTPPNIVKIRQSLKCSVILLFLLNNET